jgi:branched-chain amino acid transport system substrate-binding protein
MSKEVKSDVRSCVNKTETLYRSLRKEKPMKKKVLFGVTALLIVALIVPLVTACPQTPVTPEKDKIIIGMSRPLSGPLAIIGDSAFKPIYDAWIPLVNADGGVYLTEFGKKLPIETIIYDDKSDVGTMTRLTEKLILEDKVDFLWPACGTSFVFAQGPIANKYNYVLITAEGGATTITDSLYSLPYVFIGLSYSNWYQLPVFADMLAAKGAKTAYVVYMADLFGIEYSGVAGTEFGRVGMKVVGNVSVPADLKDFAPLVLDAMASGADVFCILGYPDQVLPVTGTAIGLGYNPKAFIGGPGAQFGFYHTAFGPAVEGVCGFATWNDKQTPALKELADILYTGKPEDIQDWWGHCLYWATADIWKAAVEQAGTLDQKAIRDVLATTKLDTVLGPTWFTMFGDGGGILAKECHPGEIGQWINGKFEVVGGGNWPATKLTADFIYPKPAWPTP